MALIKIIIGIAVMVTYLTTLGFHFYVVVRSYNLWRKMACPEPDPPLTTITPFSTTATTMVQEKVEDLKPDRIYSSFDLTTTGDRHDSNKFRDLHHTLKSDLATGGFESKSGTSRITDRGVTARTTTRRLLMHHNARTTKDPRDWKSKAKDGNSYKLAKAGNRGSDDLKGGEKKQYDKSLNDEPQNRTAAQHDITAGRTQQLLNNPCRLVSAVHLVTAAANILMIFGVCICVHSFLFFFIVNRLVLMFGCFHIFTAIMGLCSSIGWFYVTQGQFALQWYFWPYTSSYVIILLLPYPFLLYHIVSRRIPTESTLHLQEPRQVDALRQVDASRQVDAPRQVDDPRQVDAPRPSSGVFGCAQGVQGDMQQRTDDDDDWLFPLVLDYRYPDTPEDEKECSGLQYSNSEHEDDRAADRTAQGNSPYDQPQRDFLRASEAQFDILSEPDASHHHQPDAETQDTTPLIF